MRHSGGPVAFDGGASPDSRDGLSAGHPCDMANCGTVNQQPRQLTDPLLDGGADPKLRTPDNSLAGRIDRPEKSTLESRVGGCTPTLGALAWGPQRAIPVGRVSHRRRSLDGGADRDGAEPRAA